MVRRSGVVTLLLLLVWSATSSAQDRGSPADAGGAAAGPDAGAFVPAVTGDAGAAAGDGGSPENSPATPAEPAPTPSPEAEPTAVSPPDHGQEMVVTGSRLAQGSSFSPAAPVQVLDRKQLEQTGATNMADVVSYLNVQQGSGFQGAGSQSYNSVSINLRGLGEGATLVLLNGRRLPLSGAYNPKGQQFSDLSWIPLVAVERIEILKGGASAIYGSDAVAGVVNIITRKNFDGARVELDGQTTTRFDERNGTASVALGASNDHARAFLAGSFFSNSELVANQRDWTQNGYLNSEGYPGTFIVGTKTVPDPACNSVPGSMVTPGTAGSICSYQYRNFVTLNPQTTRGNMFGSAEYDISRHVTAFAEILASQMRGGYISSPSFPVPPPFLTVPANHVDNPFGQPVQAIISPVGAVGGPTRAVTDDDMLRALVGIKGDLEGVAANTLLETWTWELYASAASDRNVFILPDTLRGVIQSDLNSCSNPANLTNCYNPFYSSVTGTGTPNSTAVVNSFFGAQQSITDSQMETVNAGMTGSLLSLPGGDLALALGGELRHESRATRFDHDSNQDEYSFLIGNPNAQAAREVYAGYGELGWPFLRGLRLQTAARVEYYSDIERSALSPTAGLTFSPADLVGREKAPAIVRKLQFRGQVASAYRAPNLYQSFPGYVVLPSSLNVGQTLPVYLPVQGSGNPSLKPEHALAVSGGVTWEPVRELDLAADFWDYDYKDRIELQNAQQLVNQYLASGPNPQVVVDPISNQISEVMTKYVNIPGDVVTNGLDFSAFLTLDSKTFGGSVPDDESQRLRVGAVGTYLMTFNYPFSEASPRTLANGTVLPPAFCNGTSPTSTCNAAGLRNFNNVWQSMPRWRVNFPVTWSYRGHAVSFITHYISSYLDDVDPRPDGTFDTISAWVTFDAQYTYTIRNWIGRELTMRIGAYNIGDANPPAVNGLTTSYDYTLADPRGRMVYAKMILQL